MEISVVIPVYNGGKTIPELFRKLKRELESNFTWEVIFIYDCGKDNSWSVIKEIKKNNSDHVKGYHLKHNYGQHNAILFGITKAIGDFIITIDEDLQHDPLFIKELSEKQIEGNYDVVYTRFKKLKHPGFRVRTSEMLRRILRIIVPGIFPGYSPYRLIKSEVAKKITVLRNSYTFIDGYLGMVTKNFGYIDAEHFIRADGVSSYSYLKLFKHAVMIAFAYSPLKNWILTSALVLNSLAVVLFIKFQFLAGINSMTISGILSGVGGIILLFIGLIAEAIHYRGMKSNVMPEAIAEE